MAQGEERIARIRKALQEAGLDALVCTLPANILLLSGYWPVVGSAVAIATRDGRVAVLAPKDEDELAQRGWAHDVCSYQPDALTHLTGGPDKAVRAPLAALLRDLGLDRARLGFEAGSAYEPASYVAMYLYGSAATSVLGAAAPAATLAAGSEALRQLRASLTPEEVDRLRLACSRAQAAFARGACSVQPGLLEPEVVNAFSLPLSMPGPDQPAIGRSGGHVFCMSGPNSAEASGAYARTRTRELKPGDLVLVHCNSYVDGYWTDITRTYCLGEPSGRQQAMYEAIFTAHRAAIAAIRPGIRASEVDRAAREVLSEHGFGKEFTHGVGHNVGFSAISMEFPPRLHPASEDILEVGMTFNIEPAIYIGGFGGIRHCDVVTLREGGPEVLTPFQAAVEDLILPA